MVNEKPFGYRFAHHGYLSTSCRENYNFVKLIQLNKKNLRLFIIIIVTELETKFSYLQIKYKLGTYYSVSGYLKITYITSVFKIQCY